MERSAFNWHGKEVEGVIYTRVCVTLLTLRRKLRATNISGANNDRTNTEIVEIRTVSAEVRRIYLLILRRYLRR